MEKPKPIGVRKLQPSGGDLLMFQMRGWTLPNWVLRHAPAFTTTPLGFVARMRFKGQ